MKLIRSSIALPELLVVVIQKYLSFSPVPFDVDVGDAWAKLLLQLSAEPRAGAGLGKEQRPAKNHENKLILILFLMYV